MYALILNFSSVGAVLLSAVIATFFTGSVDNSTYFYVLTVALVYTLLANNSQPLRATPFSSKVKNSLIIWTAVILTAVFIIFLSDQISIFPRLWIFSWWVAGLIVVTIQFAFIYALLSVIRACGYNQKKVVVVGFGKLADDIVEKIIKSKSSGFILVEHISNVDPVALEKYEYTMVDEIWLALPLSEHTLLNSALHALRHCSASIRFAPDFFSFQMINHDIVYNIGFPMFNISATSIDEIGVIFKWVEDKLLSIIILILISPVMLLVAIGIKMTSPGPIFYKQERVGLNNKKFMMLKFRSMPVDVENEVVNWGGASRKVNTKFGSLIRKLSLDELPQFLNVLLGEMSIVGPRPERPMFVDKFKDDVPSYMKKHLVKAGITGWAQVNGYRGDTCLRKRVSYDIYYIENWSILFDLKIIFLTLFGGISHNDSA